MTTENDRQALKQTRSERVAEAIRELRAFTGVAGYVPALDEPEHPAYLKYEQVFANGHKVWRGHQRRRQDTVDLLIEQRNEARRSMDAEQKQRRKRRVESNVSGRILGKLRDVSFPAKRDHAALSTDVDEAWETRYAADARVLEIETELARSPPGLIRWWPTWTPLNQSGTSVSPQPDRWIKA